MCYACLNKDGFADADGDLLREYCENLRDLSFITEYDDAYERAYDRLCNLAMRGEGKTCLSGKSRIALR